MVNMIHTTRTVFLKWFLWSLLNVKKNIIEDYLLYFMITFHTHDQHASFNCHFNYNGIFHAPFNCYCNSCSIFHAIRGSYLMIKIFDICFICSTDSSIIDQLKIDGKQYTVEGNNSHINWSTNESLTRQNNIMRCK